MHFIAKRLQFHAERKKSEDDRLLLEIVWFFNYDFCTKPSIYFILLFQVTGLQATLRNLESGHKIELPMKKGSACEHISQNGTSFYLLVCLSHFL